MIHKKVFSDRLDMYFDDRYKFIETFDKETGQYIRSDNIEGKDPFMRSMPNLLDIGVAGSCKNGKLGICAKSGVQCYQSGLTVSQSDMMREDYKSVIDQVKGKVHQVALGGRGDPNLCNDFEFYCKYARTNGIVPNYTTSGIGLTDRQVQITRDLVGAVAVSWYRNTHTLEALDAFTSAGITTNIHYVLSNNSIDEAIDRLEKQNFFGEGHNRINAVIFLLHKPVGLGKSGEVLQFDDWRVAKFFELVDDWNGDFKIGFDSCSIPGILSFTDNISLDSIDTCEGARFSAYITPDMIMTPCSFDQELKYGISLKEYTIEEAWDSMRFWQFRNKLKSSCPDCKLRYNCMGGCPLKSEIVLCDRKGE